MVRGCQAPGVPGRSSVSGMLFASRSRSEEMHPRRLHNDLFLMDASGRARRGYLNGRHGVQYA
jgi:hypothetical protein